MFPFRPLLIIVLLTIIPWRGRAQDRVIEIDLQHQGQPLMPLWAYFGCDEPNYTYGNDGRKLLSELSDLSPTPVYMRVHNLLTTGDGRPALKWGSTNAYTEDSAGGPVYNWTIVDSIFDAFVKRGIRPIAEVGFMPEALSTHPEPYRHHWQPGQPYGDIYTGWAYPPKDYAKWAALVYQWVRHSIVRYGEDQVKTWYWEVWNEPNISYWKGTPEEYDCLYDYTVDAVKRACPGARVGGPASTGPGWKDAALYLQNFLAHCHTGKNYVSGKTGAPLDFISFHAKGNPKVTDGHVQMNMAPQLTDVATGFRIVSGSVYASLPILVTECDPEGCAACSMATSPQNAYRNGTMYSSYTAATFSRLYDLADRYRVHLEGAITWAFTFEGQRWFDGFRDLATNGVDKPVLNVFRMYGMMVGNRVGVEYAGYAGNRVGVADDIPLDSLLLSSVRGSQTDVHALASAGKGSTSVMVWNYHDDETKRDTVRVRLDWMHIPAASVKISEYRIDGAHSNAYEEWMGMGSPQHPSEQQIAQLEKDGQLQFLETPQTVAVKDGQLSRVVALPAQGVSLIKLEYVQPDLSHIYFIDTHNDVLTKQVSSGADLSVVQKDLELDLPKARQGHLAAQVFSIWCGEEYGPGKAFARANQEIDSLYALIRRHPGQVMLARNEADFRKARRSGRLAAFIGVEGGHMIEERMDYLDSLAKRGMCYMTLTWNNSTSWATSARDETLKKDSLSQAGHMGLTDKGRDIVRHMNDLGVMVDVSHVGDQTLSDVLAVSRKPVIASHSSAYALNPFRRNLKDDQLKAIARNGGVVFVNFYSGFVDSTYMPKQALFLGQHQRELDSLTRLLNDPDEATIRLYSLYPVETNALRPPFSLLMRHIDYVARLIGVDHVGIGADFDGAESFPLLMNDASDYPLIASALQQMGYSPSDIQKIAGGNFLRVLRANRP